MNLLLDSHTWLWLAADPGKLGRVAVASITDRANTRHLSAASIWELAIKAARGRLYVAAPLGDLVERSRHLHALTLLDVTPAHALRAGPLPPHHRDPFDRMLVAQALEEGLTLVTADPKLARYGVPVLSATE